MKTVLLSILSLMLFMSTTNASDDNWKLEKEKDGIKVWTRRTPNSVLKEYRGTVVLNTSIEKLLALFRNAVKHEKFMYKCQEGSVKVLKRINENDFYTRMVFVAPLIKSREGVTHFTVSNPDAKGIVFVNLESTPDLIPKDDNYVRIPKMKGYWKFTPLEGGKVEITHQAISSAGGGIPDALVNLSAVDAPFSMLTKLKEILK